MANSPILEKLRKLIAHEKSARTVGNIHEAEAFASKIQELMDTYKVGMTDVEFAEREATEPIDQSEYVGPVGWKGGDGRRQYWTMTLARTIANVNECKVVCSRGNKFCFVGRTNNRDFCVTLFTYMFELGEQLCRKYAKEEKEEQHNVFMQAQGKYYHRSYEQVNAFRHWMKDYNKSWKAGFADAIATRLYEMQTRRDAAAAKTGAMVHIKKDALAVREFMDNEMNLRGTSTSNRTANHEGYKRGESVGKAVNLTPHNLGSSKKAAGALPAYSGWKDATRRTM